jgi:uncharacterized protein (TIGR00369 family)
MAEFKLPPGIAPLPYASLLQVEIVEASKDGIRGKMKVRPDICTGGHILHGGAIMSFADTLGAFGAMHVLPEGGQGTTTLETKTNFLGSAKEGETVLAHCTPVHVGRRTSVWQTRITTDWTGLVPRAAMTPGWESRPRSVNVPSSDAVATA